jgi:hypothetical protein
MDKQLPVAKIIHSLPCMDGDAHKIYNPAITLWRQRRQCAWCGIIFHPALGGKWRRFCGKSCSAKWRMNTPEHKAKVHTPEVAAKRGLKKSAWLRSNDPKAKKEMERITNLNPMGMPGVREKVSLKLRAMGHRPSAPGGNGTGLTVPQQILLDALGNGWIAEYSLSLGQRTRGYPTAYKLDLANPERKINIEVDGGSHYSRKTEDQKRDAKITSLGWIVLRFWNKDILSWKNSGMPMDTYISMILKQNDIPLSR